MKKKMADWIGHILRRNCLLKYVIEGKIEVARGRKRRLRELLDDLKENRGCWKLKAESLCLTLWATGFGGGFKHFSLQ
jgi:hypothetical protein